LTIDGGAAFPHREEIIFLTFSVILVTLLLQGLSLPYLIERLGFDDVDSTLEHEENIARKRAAQAALDRLEELTGEDWVREDTAERIGGLYRYRHRRFSARFADDDGESQEIEERSGHFQRLSRELLEAQRATVIEMRNRGEINDDVLRTIERELDFEDSRLEI
jgi:CPA1 family monovalent cation:H+ antiporter